MNKWQTLNEAALDVESVDIKKVISTLNKIFPKLGVSYRKITGELRKTISNKELVFRAESPSIVDIDKREKLTRLSVVVWIMVIL